MREGDFRAWLERQSYSRNTVNTQLAQARRLDQAYGDLDALYEADGFAGLRQELGYTSVDKRDGKPNPAKFPISGDLYANLASYRASLTYYARFATAPTEHTAVNRDALEKLKQNFLRLFPDFEAGGGFTGVSRYHQEEDDYKRALVARVSELLHRDPAIDDIALGAAILDGLSTDTNLLGYYKTTTRLKGIRAAHPGVFEAAIGVLARSNDPPSAAAETFLKVAWPLLLEGSEDSQPFGESRIFATVVQALARPEAAISVIYQRFHNLGIALLGRSPFENNVLTAAEYEGVLDLVRTIFTVMDGEWDWHPRDLWDVQGFIWVTCKNKLEGEGVGPAIDRSAVEAVMDECDTLGDEAFAKKYNRGLSGIRYRAVRAGVRYPSKAIANAAYEHMHGERGQYGGTQARQVLAALGYEIVGGSTATQDRDAEAGEAPGGETPTNLILFGPPGTGKTYASAGEAVRLCDRLAANAPILTDDDLRPALMQRYRELSALGRIAFVTFHESYSYEEFVEGLRPHQGLGDGDAAQAGFSLQSEPGLLLRIAKRAMSVVRSDAAPLSLTDRRIFKMSIGEAANPEEDYLLEESLAGGYVLLGWGNQIDLSRPEFAERDAILKAAREKYAQHVPDREISNQSGYVKYSYAFRNRVREGDILVISRGNSRFRAIAEVMGPYEYQPRDTDEYANRRKVRWLWQDREGVPVEEIYPRGFSMGSLYELARADLNLAALEQYAGAGQASVAADEGEQPFVLVIDEINRANISRVFGELITLIEADKRLGGREERKVILPYSKTEFGLPANLHIVGTMNTADRSIALLDTALRRRFDFRELMPRPDRLADASEDTGIDLVRLLDVLNDRIEYLLDRDHQIGHAYLIGCGTKADVDERMRNRIIPLLQEYFYEDLAKVRRLLGDGFIETTKLAPFGRSGDDGEQERVRYRVRRTFDQEAYDKLTA
ncbi:hypothetical protein FHT00_003437 [Sphingomonas insulae]|uniref:AAA+ ATPase domain-containing protein n=1 Tax=Sphingomonas insulae TaxID=424800 RepID=A0ABN1I0C5_9SPHN|nr:AAA family ATPase [Sphingomonas insulae]NIJ31457.1 hypothetical protein [Sphingomonas insulae]